MQWFNVLAVLLVLTAFLSFVNLRLFRMPATIGVMTLTLAGSLIVIGVGKLVPGLHGQAEAFVAGLQLGPMLLDGMLGFLLFAGAIHLNWSDLTQNKLAVAVLATVGVLLSTAIVGGLSWLVLAWVGLPMRLGYCFLFGALISPTDPVAVLALLRRFGVPRALETKIAGESLFNDGVAIVVFLGVLQIAIGGGFDPGQLALLFVREAVGGAALGLAAGLFVYVLLRTVDDYHVEIQLSLALVAGGYALAGALEVSGAIAMVVAGLVIGNPGRKYAMTEQTVKRLDLFWELIDEILNAVLFVLLGAELLVLQFSVRHLDAGLAMIPVVLLARLLSVSVPALLLGRWGNLARGTIPVLTWGGLRGGIAVALALSIPSAANGQAVPERNTILVITYIVVVFSILVQGMTIGPLAKHWLRHEPNEPAAVH